MLYNAKGTWRFSVYNDEGILDGRLSDMETDEVIGAQQRLIAQVEELTGFSYSRSATWWLDKPHWWPAELSVTAER